MQAANDPWAAKRARLTKAHRDLPGPTPGLAYYNTGLLQLQ